MSLGILAGNAAKSFAAPAAGSFLSSIGGLGGVGQLLGGIGSLFGGSDDGVHQAQLGAQRVQSDYMMGRQYHWNKKALWNALRTQEYFRPQELDQQYAAWDKWQLPHLQQQMQYRVKDAKKAGLHPLFALGQPGHQGPAFSISGGPGAPGVSGGAAPLPGQTYTGSSAKDKLAGLANAAIGIEQLKMQKEAHAARS